MTTNKIAILGAGPAGLGLALQILRQFKNCEIHVFEQKSHVGGLTSSFEHAGLIFDYGSHRLHPATLPPILKDLKNMLGEELLDRPRNGRIRLLNKFVRFPLNAANLAVNLPPSFVGGVVFDSVTKRFRGREKRHQSFAEYLLAGLGPTVCHNFYFPYARKLWGLEPFEISAVQAELRVSANNFTKIMKKLMLKLPGIRGNSAGRFFYPKRGFGQISDRLAEDVIDEGGRIYLNHKIVPVRQAAEHATEKPLRIKLGNQDVFIVGVDRAPPNNVEKFSRLTGDLEVDFVFSTIPITSLIECVHPPAPAEILDSIQKITYRAMVLLYMVIDDDRFQPYDAHYFPDDKIVFSRISEPKCYYDGKEPVGVTGLCLEIPCSYGDDIWTAGDDRLCELVLKQMAEVELPVRSKMRELFSIRLPNAYPVYNIGYERHFNMADSYLNTIDGLICLGRQALFMHNNTHHSLEMAYRAAECLGDNLEWNDSLWRSYRKHFSSQVVED